METGSQFTCSLRVARNMVRAWLLLSILYIQVGVSDQVPPRVSSCRTQFKAKQAESTTTFTFGDRESCVDSVDLPIPENNVVNFTDPRNCANYYKCTGPACDQCPCPDGETFDPITLRCSTSASPCVCPERATTTQSSILKLTSTTTTPITTASTTISTGTRGAEISAANGNNDVPEKVIIPRTSTRDPGEVDDGVVIIAAMVSATVIILLLLVIGFFLWHRGLFALRKKPQMVSANNDGYLHTLPSQERHVYAEIDERMITEANNNASDTSTRTAVGHSTSPPVPNHPPPACVHHPHHTYMLPHSFYAAPSITYAEGHSINSINKAGGLSPLPHLDSCDNSSMTSCSGCSHCSASTNQTQLEGYNLDMRTLLQHTNSPPVTKESNQISKQVYV